MGVISKTEDVPFSADQMYELVNDVESYPEFLSWCRSSKIHERSPHHMKASITLVKGRIKQSFTTENTMQPGRRIDVSLVEGPFKQLTGFWEFEPEGVDSCRVSVMMQFEFRNRLLKLALEAVFNQITGTLIENFTERARQVFGTR